MGKHAPQNGHSGFTAVVNANNECSGVTAREKLFRARETIEVRVPTRAACRRGRRARRCRRGWAAARRARGPRTGARRRAVSPISWRSPPSPTRAARSPRRSTSARRARVSSRTTRSSSDQSARCCSTACAITSRYSPRPPRAALPAEAATCVALPGGCEGGAAPLLRGHAHGRAAGGPVSQHAAMRAPQLHPTHTHGRAAGGGR